MYILRFEKPISVPQIPLPQLFEYLLYPTKIHKKERTGHIETFFFFFHQHPNMIYLFIKNLDMTGFQNFFFIFPELALRSLPLKILNSSYKPTHASNLVNSNLYHGFFFVFVCLFIFSLSTVSSGIAWPSWGTLLTHPLSSLSPCEFGIWISSLLYTYIFLKERGLISVRDH